MSSIWQDGVVVIGAGVAGLAATRRLRRAGVAVQLIEAAPRIGGRAWTTTFAGAPFDHGATWLHAADRNELVGLATADDALRQTDQIRSEHVLVDGRNASPAELAGYDAAWNRLERTVAPLLGGPDRTLAAAMAAMADDPWANTVALWEGAIIAGADADALGLADWHMNELTGPNLQPQAGVGAFVVRRLAEPAALGTRATEIAWADATLTVATTGGTIRAGAAIVTVSTGVLASGALRFTPGLPAPVMDAIHRLPMGLLSKVALAAPDPATFGLAPDCLIVERDGSMVFNAWPWRRRYVTAFFGGRLAWSLAHDAAAAAATVRDTLRRLLGGDWSGASLVTGWGTDTLHLGGYAYAGPGDAGQRAVLAEAFPAERLLFAGEATRIDGLAGTVGGAYLSGTEAADRLLATAPSSVASNASRNGEILL